MTAAGDFNVKSGGKLLDNLLLFGRLCRALGMDVTPTGMIEVAPALEYVSLGSKAGFYFARNYSGGCITKEKKELE